MADTLEILVPTEQSDITLEQYKEWIRVVETVGDEKGKEDFLNKTLIEIFCKVPVSDIAKIKATEYNKILMVLQETFTKDNKELVMSFELNGIEYGFEPNIEEMITSTYVDAEAGLGSWEDMHTAMAALYRRVTGKRVTRGVEQYEIEEYSPTDEKSNVMLDAPLDAVLSAKVFFCNLGTELSLITLACLEQELQKEQDIQLKKTLEQNGDGINRFIHSLEETYSSLMKQHPYHYIKLSHS